MLRVYVCVRQSREMQFRRSNPLVTIKQEQTKMIDVSRVTKARIAEGNIMMFPSANSMKKLIRYRIRDIARFRE